MNRPYPHIRATGTNIGGRPIYEIVDDFCFSMELGPHGKYQLSIPAGMLTDFGSVPKWLWPFLNPMDEHWQVAFLIHDDLYQHAYPRRPADMFMRMVGDHYGAPWWEQIKAFYGVRLGGRWNWPSKPLEVRLNAA